MTINTSKNAVDILIRDIITTFSPHINLDKCIIFTEQNKLRVFMVQINTYNPVAFFKYITILENIINKKIYAGISEYFIFSLIKEEIKILGNEYYNLSFLYQKIEDFKDYLTILPKDIFLQISLAITDEYEFKYFTNAFSNILINNDYKILCGLLYPKLLSFLLKEHKDIEDYIWKSLYLFFRYDHLMNSLKLYKLGDCNSEKTKKVLINFLKRECSYMCPSPIISGLFNKILVKFIFPFLYSYIKDIYTLNDFGGKSVV